MLIKKDGLPTSEKGNLMSRVGWLVLTVDLFPAIEASVSKDQMMTYNDYTLYHIFVVIVLSN